MAFDIRPLDAPLGAEYQVQGFPELRVLSSRHRDTLADNRLLRVGGSWHSDHSHQQKPPRGTMLHALELPGRASATPMSGRRATC